MKFSTFAIGLLVYLALQSGVFWLMGLDTWTIVALGGAAVILSQLIYLLLVVVAVRKEERRRAQEAAYDEAPATQDRMARHSSNTATM